MYLAVVEALLDRGLDQPVLVDPRETLELGAATVARRWSPAPVSSLTSTAAPGSASSIIAFSSARSAISEIV